MNTGGRQEEDQRSALVNTRAILDMQRKLYRWSHENPSKVFSDLFNLVCDRRTLALAWQRLARNAGSRTPGTDGVTRRTIEQRPGGVTQYLEDIRQALRTGTYRPQPVRQRLIPKPGKPGKFRPLGIPTLTDRLIQMALKLILEPIYEADFYPTSYGFRRGRSTHHALARIQRQLGPTRAGTSSVAYVIEGDIKGCFDNIDHHLLMDRVRQRVRDRKVLRLILAFLKAGVMIEGTIRHPITGTPQGGIISPLLSNVLLTAIDERYRRWTPPPREPVQNSGQRRRRDQKLGRPTFYNVRYADDFVILVSGSEEDARTEKDALSQFLKDELRMELSMEKTLVTAAEEGFSFLGFRVVKKPALKTGRPVGKLYIPKPKMQLLRDKIKDRTNRSSTVRSLADLFRELNPIIIGWRNYYRYALSAKRELVRLDSWMWFRIFRWLRKKHHGTTANDICRRYLGRHQGRKTWSADGVWLARFTDTRATRHWCRGAKIANGWNDGLETGHLYKDDPLLKPAYFMLGTL